MRMWQRVGVMGLLLLAVSVWAAPAGPAAQAQPGPQAAGGVAEAVGPQAPSAWGSVSVGSDADGYLYALFENVDIQVKYGHFFENRDQSAIVLFKLKDGGYQDQSGRYIDATSNRGVLTKAVITYDGDDRKSVWLEWDDGTKIQEVSIFPTGAYLRIDYFRYGTNLVDQGSPGGSSSGGSYEFYGNSCWLDCVTPRGYVLYPQSYYNRYDAGYTDPANGGSLNYNGSFIGGIYQAASGNGYARALPVPTINIIKLLSSRGFEWYPYFGSSSKPAYRSWLYGVTDGASEVLATGQNLVNLGGTPPSTYALNLNVTPPGAGTIARSLDQTIYRSGQVVALTASPSPGYVFSGWSGDINTGANPANITLSSTRVVTATFTHVGYTVAANVAGGGTVTREPDQAAYSAGTVVTLTAAPDPGWSFIGWTGDWAGSANPAVFDVRSHRVVTAVFAQSTSGGWWNNGWSYRVPVQVNANGFPRLSRPAEVNLNFASLLSGLGAAGTFDPASLRVVEVSAQGVVLDETVDFQFDDPDSNANGTLIFMLDGLTPGDVTRYFHVYFDVASHGPFTPPAVTPRITVNSGARDESQDAFRVQTLTATYYYQKQGASFSSIDDVDGLDWLGYHPTGGSAGNFRGLPNMNDYVHPGATAGTSSLVSQGPLKATVYSDVITGTQRYKLTWEFFPDFARMTLLENQNSTPYWFLYEGTPYGQLNKVRDFAVLSDGITRPVDNASVLTWNGDIPAPEWAFFGDNNVNRVLFVAHHGDDAQTDTFYQYQDNMTVFGFGRDGAAGCSPACSPKLTLAPNTFTIGLAEGLPMAADSVNSAYRDLTTQVGAASERPNNHAPVLGAVGDQNVFNGALLAFTLTATDVDTDTLTYGHQGLPAGATLDPATGAFSWTPTVAQTGDHAVTLTVSDGLATDSETITLTVGNRAPTLTAVGDKTIGAGQTLSFTLSASDPDGNAMTYSATGLPAGATLNLTTGAFSWTPSVAQVGDHVVTFTASDSLLADGETITLTVADVPVTGGYSVYLPAIQRSP